MNVSVTIENREVRRLIGQVKAYQLRKRGQILALNAEYALKIEASAKKNAPVDTGRLRSSIRHVLDNASLSAEVITDVEYAIYQEFGTSRMSANAFLRPAFEEHIGDYLRDLKRIMAA